MAAASGGRAVILLALVAGGLLWWMWRRGELRGVTTNDAVAAVAGLVGLWALFRGELVMAGLMLAGTVFWFSRRRMGRRPVISMRADEARRILDVSADADAGTIKLAHRRLVARVHPDQGGSAELAARVNAARDTLLAELVARRRG
jgi:hypothetical protein